MTAKTSDSITAEARLTAALDWQSDEFRFMMTLALTQEEGSTERLVLDSLGKHITALRAARVRLTSALDRVEREMVDIRRRLDEGSRLNDCGVFQVNVDMEAAAVEATRRGAMEALELAEKVLGQKVL